MESPSRRTFLKNGAAAVVAGPSLMQLHVRSLAVPVAFLFSQRSTADCALILATGN